MTTLVMLPPQTERSRAWASRLRDDVSRLDVVVPESADEVHRALPTAEAAYGALPEEWLEAAPGLRWLQAPAAGPEPGYYYDALARHPVTVTNMRGTYTEIVAAHAVALLLALARDLPRYASQQARGEWQLHQELASCLYLPSATVLIVGAGAVGAEVARLIRPFGAKVVATDARLTEAPDGIDWLSPASELADVIGDADAVVVTVPHTPDTDGLFDREMLARMRPGARLVNVGRGPVVDVDALAEALASGAVGGAALDVFPQEPLPAGHPLWSDPRMLITPHSAGIGPGSDERRYRVLVDNARRFVAGEPLINVVDKRKWF
jgi:phosphoglycerate dehydrogenase-like enzyme